MERFAARRRSWSLETLDNRSEEWMTDERWTAAQHIVASVHFSHAPLLSRFLLYIVAESISGHEARITEHEIGVQVFDRPETYRTIEDNIVRNYARQLRRRLADYYAAEGANETTRIDIPLGGYVPAFHTNAASKPHAVAEASAESEKSEVTVEEHLQKQSPPPRHRKIAIAVVLLVLYTAAIAVATWFVKGRFQQPEIQATATGPLWNALLDGPLNTYIVPADAGYNLLDDISNQTMALADYMNGAYNSVPLPSLDNHSARDLRSQQFTSYVALQAVMAIGQLPGFHPRRDIIRFPRNLHLEDLQNANVILLGSEDSNPWTSIAQKNANFRILGRHGMQGAEIVNTHPLAGEQPSYISHWNDPEHETFALIQYLKNLSGTGHILIVQGLDVAGTQAAAQTLLHPKTIAAILQQARQPDGRLRSFEILLRSTSIASNAEGTQVIASRIY